MRGASKNSGPFLGSLHEKDQSRLRPILGPLILENSLVAFVACLCLSHAACATKVLSEDVDETIRVMHANVM